MKKWDKEYSTQYWKEVKFLEKNGINYTFVKVENEISTFKYKKSSELFKLLDSFYMSETN